MSTPRSERLGIAILGCGNVAAKHAKTLKKVGGNVDFYFASRSLQKAEAANAKWRGSGAFGSYAEALEERDVDVVLITTTPDLHFTLCQQSLAAGKHVIVEKPAFIKSSHFEEIEALAAERNRRVFIAENYFYKPMLKKLREVLSEGLIGEPICMYVNALKQQEVSDWRNDPALTGGGALFEGGVHWVNFMANLGFKVDRVRGSFPGNPKKREDRSSVLTFDYENGASGTLFYSWECPSLLKGLRVSRIYGTEGSIFFESNGLVGAVNGKKKRVFFPGVRDIAGYQGMFRDYLKALRTGVEPELTFTMARNDYKYIEQAYDSAQWPLNSSSYLQPVGEKQCSGS